MWMDTILEPPIERRLRPLIVVFPSRASAISFAATISPESSFCWLSRSEKEATFLAKNYCFYGHTCIEVHPAHTSVKLERCVASKTL